MVFAGWLAEQLVLDYIFPGPRAVDGKKTHESEATELENNQFGVSWAYSHINECGIPLSRSVLKCITENNDDRPGAANTPCIPRSRFFFWPRETGLVGIHKANISEAGRRRRDCKCGSRFNILRPFMLRLNSCALSKRNEDPIVFPSLQELAKGAQYIAVTKATGFEISAEELRRLMKHNNDVSGRGQIDKST